MIPSVLLPLVRRLAFRFLPDDKAGIATGLRKPAFRKDFDGGSALRKPEAAARFSPERDALRLWLSKRIRARSSVVLGLLSLSAGSAFATVPIIAAGASHSLAVKSDGTVWAWGSSNYGQVGDGASTNRATPVQVSGLTGAVTVAGGTAHSLAVKSDGTVRAWGQNLYGRLGDGTTTDRLSPVTVSGLTGAVAVAAGASHSLALKSDGTVWAWGYNLRGQLGDNSTTSRTTPVQVSGLTGVIFIAGGDSHSLAVKSDGTVWAWGYNNYGQLGDNSTTNRSTPVQVSGLTGAVSVAGGTSHSLAVKSDGTAWAWGLNSRGQLGDGSTTNQPTPVQVTGVTGAAWMAGGASHSLVAKSDGTMRAWGSNTLGQLGNGSSTDRATALQVTGLSGVVSVRGGSAHALAVKSDGTVQAWGSNGAGQLGDGTTTERTTPVSVSSLTGVVSVAGGSSHSLALKSGGTVWGWGYNAYGQLGDGSTTNRPTPVQVTGLTGVVSVAGGLSHSLAVKSDGTLWAWGYNNSSQLGDGSTTTRTTAVQVSGLTGVATAAGGDSYSLAVKSDGTVWAWGQNLYGRLGDGTTTTRTTPVQVSGLTGAVLVACGVEHSLALKADGTVWAWGNNLYAQLGNGAISSPVLTPVQVVGLTNVVSVVCKTNHSLALKSDGTVWAWGPAYVNTGMASQTTPIQVSALAGVEPAVGGSNSTAYFVKKDGTLLAWGAVASGQLANAFTDRYTESRPVLGLHLTAPVPSATITSPANDTVVPMGGSATVEAGVTIASGSIDKVSFYTDGYFLGDDNSSPYTFSYTPASWGAYEIHAIALSSAGAFSVPAYVRIQTPYDHDADGLPDYWELQEFSNLSQGASGDPDGDGLTNLQEHTSGTNPQSADTDGDGLLDKWELDNGLNPSSGDGADGGSGDFDGDGYTNLQEYHQETDPNNINSRPKGMIVANKFHTVALASDGRVWSWGYNYEGQLGDGSTESRSSPVPVIGVAGMAKVLAIDTSWDYSVALDQGGNLWAWGSNVEHVISNDATLMYDSPVRIELPAPVFRFACGRNHMVAVDRDGKLWSWGNNSEGQLGLGHSNVVTGPAEITKPSGMGAIVSLKASQYTTFVVDAAGKAWSWGKNNVGQLGDGSNTDRKTPVAIDITNGVPVIRSISAGLEHGIASGVDGSIWTWGYNGYGQLGLNDFTNRNKPFIITLGLTSAAKIGAGCYHSLAVSQTGYVWGWGTNNDRQLGLPSILFSKIPIQSGNATEWETLFQVAGGEAHSVALKDDGTVWSWGGNSYGQLGLGDYDQRPAATRLPKLKLSNDDSDADGLPDSWEYYYFNGSLSQGAGGVYVVGGTSNLSAYTHRLNPTLTDNDNDGISDSVELSAGLDPLDWADATADMDGDRIPNAWEIALGSSMSNPDLQPSGVVVVNPGETIQSRINSIVGNSGNPTWGIVRVPPGVYSENITIPANKRILLMSSGTGGVPEIRGATDSPTIEVYGDSVIDGFRITHVKGVAGDGVNYNQSGARELSRIVNCVIHGHRGAGKSAVVNYWGRLVIAHCTIFQNDTYSDGFTDGHALHVNYESQVLVLNSILWNPENPLSKEVYANGITESRQSIIRDASIAGALTDDPLLNASGLLTGLSPARRKGGLRAPSPRDIQNESRATEPDIGADQFVDTDSDMLPDLWEKEFWTSVHSQTSSDDSDGDGITNDIEHLIGKSPLAYNGVQNIEILDRVIDAASSSRNMRIRFTSYRNQEVVFNFHKFYYDFDGSGDFGQSHFDSIATESMSAVVGENIYTWGGIETALSNFHSADVVSVEVVTRKTPGSDVIKDVAGAPSDYVDSQAVDTGVSASWVNNSGTGSTQYHNVPTPVSYTIEGGEPLLLNTKSHHTLLQNRPVLEQGIVFNDWIPIADNGSSFGGTGFGGSYEPTVVTARKLPILSAIYENQHPEVRDFTVQSYRTIPSNGEVGHIRFHLSKATLVTLQLQAPDLSGSYIYVRQANGSYVQALNLPLAAGDHDLEFRAMNYTANPAQPMHFSYQKVAQPTQTQPGFFKVRIGWAKDGDRSPSLQGFKWAHIHVE